MRLTTEQLDILYALAEGQSVTAAADAAGIHRTTIHYWIRTIPEFRLTLDAAKQARSDAMRDQLNTLVTPGFELLAKVIHDESAPLSLRVRTVLAVFKFLGTSEKTVVDKDLNAQWALIEAAFSQGHMAGRATAKPASSEEIHHNSSPSSENPPQRESAPKAPPQTPRNAPCPCGSGNKFKRCCGKDAPPVLSQAA